MRLKYIHQQLLKEGIDSYSDWLGRVDGAYMVCRPFNSQSKEAKAYLVPIDDNLDDGFVQNIIADFIKIGWKESQPKDKMIQERLGLGE